MSLELIRPPARLLAPGTYRLEGLEGASYTIGRDAIYDEIARRSSFMPGHEISVDLESCSKEGRARYDVKSVILGTPNHALVFDPRDPDQFHVLRSWINDPAWHLVFHNSPFDVPILYVIGLLDLDTCLRVWDTLIWARLATPDDRTSKSLGASAARHLGTEISDPLPALLKTLGIGKEAWYRDFDLDTPAYRLMAATDAVLTARLREPVRRAAYRQLTEGHPFSRYGVSGDEAWRLVDREQVVNRALLRRSCRGFRVNFEYLDDYRAQTEGEIGRLALEVEREGIRPGNSADLAEWLDRRDLLPERYPRVKTRYKDKADDAEPVDPLAGERRASGEKTNLKRVRHPLVATFLRHKEMVHIQSAYLDKVAAKADEDGRIHPSAGMLAAVTGRTSVAGDLPYQQIPEAARAALMADPSDRLVSIDWSQIEPVLIANIAGDAKALELYESGAKFYDAIVSGTHGAVPYKAAKIVTLASLYGEGLGKMSADLGVTIPKAREIQNMIWSVLPGTKELAGRGGRLQQIAKKYRQIFTLSGRILPIPYGRWPCWEQHDPDDLEAIARCARCDETGQQSGVMEHKGVNYPTQGGAYDILAEAILRIIEAGLGDAIYFTMHDELVVSTEAAQDIRKIMETPPERLEFMARRRPVLRTDLAQCREDTWDMPTECPACEEPVWASQAHMHTC
jgi:DNA polymerase I